MSHKKSDRSLTAMMTDRRFWPLFWTQALGAFNDNVIKNAIVMLITFKSASLFGLTSEKLVALCGGIFILPFFLFSATAGELADQRSKSRLSTFTKLWEIAIAVLAGAGFYFENLPFLLFALFMLGMQATFFGPIKFGILPELLETNDLMRGNALIELGTFISILLGTILGGVLMGAGPQGPLFVSAAAVVIAVTGWATSRKILPQPAQAPRVRITLSPFHPTYQLFHLARKVKSVFLSILAISWFWLLGSVVLSILPHLCKDVLGAHESVLTFFLAVFSLGVGAGALLSERLSFRTFELGLVPLGSFGMSLFALDIGLMELPRAVDLSTLFSNFLGWRLSIDLFFFSVSAGLFTVPLYTLIQIRSDEKIRSRIIAANNVLNAAFMVTGAIALMVLYSLDFSVQQVFLILAGANVLVAAYVYTVLPEFLFRFMCWVLAHLMYRMRTRGTEFFPDSGPAILVCNHVSFVDWILISAACPRPIRFVMHYSFLSIPFFGFFFRGAKVIPIAGQKEDPAILESALRKISAELEAGELVCIFPEGEVTRDGKLSPFRKGIERILDKNPVPVIPMALKGMWGSFFSRRYGRAMSKPFRRVWSNVTLLVLKPLPKEEATAEALQVIVEKLLAENA